MPLNILDLSSELLDRIVELVMAHQESPVSTSDRVAWPRELETLTSSTTDGRDNVKYCKKQEAPYHNWKSASPTLLLVNRWLAELTRRRQAQFSKSSHYALDVMLVNETELWPTFGGGVALMALLFAVRMGADVWVTSSSREKLHKAMRLGAKERANCTDGHWEDRLLDLMPERREFDAVIGGAGGDIVHRAVTLLKSGEKVVTYGMTRAPSLSVPMRAILKNFDICGTALGSRREFAQVEDFVRKKQIVTVISRVVNGIKILDRIDELFDMLRSGTQFGKLVIKPNSEEQCRL